ncbi:hypothetical protein Tco_0098200 [Tanacetum coccineum]|uniref:Uncharacterized protein n=1 Tax=Tanacetum coccineum TaxID=301880 RepID=A0ABQ5IBK1_9ASTR
MERSAGAKTNQTQKDRNPAQAGFRVIPDYKALAISRVGHGYHRKDLSQILKRSYFYPSIVATAQPSPPSALDIAYAVHVVSQFVSASTGPRRGVRRHSLGNSAEDHTGHRNYRSAFLSFHQERHLWTSASTSSRGTMDQDFWFPFSFQLRSLLLLEGYGFLSPGSRLIGSATLSIKAIKAFIHTHFAPLTPERKLAHLSDWIRS